MDEGQINEKVQQLKNLRQEIAVIKKELNKLNREKESWFNKRSKTNKQISALIGNVKESKDVRNEITSQVKDFKIERDKLNTEIKEQLELLKDLKKNAGDQANKFDKKANPSLIKKQIEKLDYTLETQPMSFDKEQKMQKEIKGLKKELKEIQSVTGDWEKISTLSKDINKLRKKSNAAHKKLQTHAADSQEKHESLLERSKEIDDLKKEEQASFEKFKEYKEFFKVENDKLKELLKQAEELKAELEEQNVAVEEDKKKAEAENFKEKAKIVQEKMKTGGKLTTEDLLLMQKVMKK